MSCVACLFICSRFSHSCLLYFILFYHCLLFTTISVFPFNSYLCWFYNLCISLCLFPCLSMTFLTPFSLSLYFFYLLSLLYNEFFSIHLLASQLLCPAIFNYLYAFISLYQFLYLYFFLFFPFNQSVVLAHVYCLTCDILPCVYIILALAISCMLLKSAVTTTYFCRDKFHTICFLVF